MKSAVLLTTVFALSAFIHGDATAVDPKGNEKTPLEGTWVLKSATYGGMPLDFTDDGKGKTPEWTFAGGTYKYAGPTEKSNAEGTFELDTAKTLKHLTLSPAKDEVLTKFLLVYDVDGGDLKLACSYWFAPGTPESEREEGKKMRLTRPKTLDPKSKEPIICMVLKRQQK